MPPINRPERKYSPCRPGPKREILSSKYQFSAVNSLSVSGKVHPRKLTWYWKSPFSIENTSSNGGVSIVNFLFRESMFFNVHSLKLTWHSPWKYAEIAPKGDDFIPTIHFQVRLSLVSREGRPLSSRATTGIDGFPNPPCFWFSFPRCLSEKTQKTDFPGTHQRGSLETHLQTYLRWGYLSCQEGYMLVGCVPQSNGQHEAFGVHRRSLCVNLDLPLFLGTCQK